jgi:polysaccharide biosynthesis protein PslH
MKRTLIICEYYPLPETTGSYIRTMNFVRFFRELGLVDIVYSYSGNDNNISKAIFSKEYLLKKKNYPVHFIDRSVAMLSGRPFPIRTYDDVEKKLFLSIIETNNYDYILVRYIVNAHSLFNVLSKHKKKIILDIDDLYSNSLYDSLFSPTTSTIRKIFRSLNRKLLLRYEKKCLDLNISLFCSEKDEKKLSRDVNRSYIVPNTYSNTKFEEYEFGDGFENTKILLFVGMLSYSPNFMGLKWFIENVYPKFKHAHTDAKLLVVGHLSDFHKNEVLRLCSEAQGIELHSNVPDIRIFYKRSMAVVVPILTGSGTRIKILEAALAGRPILSTPVGAEGLSLNDERELLYFRNDDEFIRSFNEICKKEKYQMLVRNAKEIVRSKYSKNSFEESMQKVLNRIDR